MHKLLLSLIIQEQRHIILHEPLQDHVHLYNNIITINLSGHWRHVLIDRLSVVPRIFGWVCHYVATG